MSYKTINPNYGKRISTSSTELYNILKAWIGVTIVFTILFYGQMGLLYSTIIALIGVGSGFLFHELAHKILAQRYGCFAEFRSFDGMMIFAIILAWLFSFAFVAPGAVMIKGHVTRRQIGKISVIGPATNLALAALFFGASFLTNNLVPGGFLVLASYYSAQINAILGFFNLIPFPGFDGSKVFAWNKITYSIMIAIALVLMAAITTIKI